MALKEELRQIEILERIETVLKYIERNTRPKDFVAEKFELLLYKQTINGLERVEEMKLQLNENAEIKVKAIKDLAGNPASVEGDKLSWDVKGDLDLGTLEVAEDGMSAKFIRNGQVGAVTVQVSGDADLGPDVKTIVGEVLVECLGGEAVVFELEATAVPVVPVI